jgi:hypothetical protein
MTSNKAIENVTRSSPIFHVNPGIFVELFELVTEALVGSRQQTSGFGKSRQKIRENVVKCIVNFHG